MSFTGYFECLLFPNNIIQRYTLIDSITVVRTLWIYFYFYKQNLSFMDDPHQMYNDFKDVIDKNFGTIKLFHKAIGVTRWTAAKYYHNPRSMQIELLKTISEATGISICILTDLIFNQK